MSLLGSNLAHKLACDVDFGPVWSNIYGCDVWATANLLWTFYNDSSDFFPVFLLNSKQTKKHNTKNTYLASCHKGNVKKVWKRMSVRRATKDLRRQSTDGYWSLWCETDVLIHINSVLYCSNCLAVCVYWTERNVLHRHDTNCEWWLTSVRRIGLLSI